MIKNVFQEAAVKDPGWSVVDNQVLGDKHVLRICMISGDSQKHPAVSKEKLETDLASYTNRRRTSFDSFEFSHAPSVDEIAAALKEYGFDPTIREVPPTPVFAFTGNVEVTPNGDVVQSRAPIKIVTPNEEDVIEYSATLHPTEYASLLSMVPMTLEENPSSMSLKGDWLYLYYVRAGSVPPQQFFDSSFFLYSVRIHKITGQILRKGYNKKLTLTPQEIGALNGASELENIIATGYFLDEPKTTLYYMKSPRPEDYVRNPALVEVPYLGTTWENGEILHTREYMRDVSL
jgi:hypothetical protein